MISMIFTGPPFCKKLLLSTIASAKTDVSEQFRSAPRTRLASLSQAEYAADQSAKAVVRHWEVDRMLTQMASASVKIISDTVAGWREAGHPLRDHSRSSQFDLTLSPAEDNSTSAHVQDHHQPQSQRPIRARTRGKQSPETASGEEQSSPV